MTIQIEKYYRYEDIPETLVKEALDKVMPSPYRQQFHIEADSGYLNDPNGFAYFDGKYHLFYQWSPLRYTTENVWYQGWYHLVSDDLINWQELGPGIEPDTVYETHGAYSGSGLALHDELLLFYTGNTRQLSGERIPYQMIAVMNSEGQLIKRKNPEIVGPLEGYTDHFRDPKIWQSETGLYRAIIGSQREDLTGTALVFVSMDTYDWQFQGEIDTGQRGLGYMWECPDYFQLGNHGVLIISPQGLAPESTRYQNIYQTGYFIGEPLEDDSLSLGKNLAFQELDQGFDFYAPQSLMTPDGRRVLIGWMGLPEIDYPTEDYGYCGTLTIPRELTVVAGKLRQAPISELANYRLNQRVVCGSELARGVAVATASEIQLKLTNLGGTDFSIKLMADAALQEYTELFYDANKSQLWLDREKSGVVFGEAYGSRRLVASEVGDELTLQIFQDTSSLEIFVNEGEAVASSRVFTRTAERFLQVDVGNEQEVAGMVWDISGFSKKEGSQDVS